MSFVFFDIFYFFFVAKQKTKQIWWSATNWTVAWVKKKKQKQRAELTTKKCAEKQNGKRLVYEFQRWPK